MATQIQSGLVATGSIGATEIATSGVTTNDINDSAVTAAKLQSSASDNSQRAVGTNHIQNSSVTTEKINFGTSLVPLGAILMWSGTTVPIGYALCNGSNGTPDLRNRFVVGSNNVSKTGTTSQAGTSPYNPGDTGGSADSTLPSHQHTGTTDKQTADHTHTFANFFYAENNGNSNELGLGNGYAGSNKGQDNDNRPFYINWETYKQSGDHGHKFTTDATGSSATNTNLPPYYALAFIMRIS